MKLLIIGNDILVIQAEQGICYELGIPDIIICSHIEVKEMFEKEKPDITIINEYGEHDLVSSDGFRTRQLLLRLINPDQRLICSGHEDYGFPDYFRVPIEKTKLQGLILRKRILETSIGRWARFLEGAAVTKELVVCPPVMIILITMALVGSVGYYKEGLATAVLCFFGVGIVYFSLVASLILTWAKLLGETMSNA